MAYWGEAEAGVSTTRRRSMHSYGLHESLLILREEGIEHAWERHQRNHSALRAGLEALGLLLVVPEAERLPQLNAVAVPEGVDEARVRQRLLEEHQLEIGAGLGSRWQDLANRSDGLQRADPENIVHCLTALGSVLSAEGLSVSGREAGKPVDAAQLHAGSGPVGTVPDQVVLAGRLSLGSVPLAKSRRGSIGLRP